MSSFREPSFREPSFREPSFREPSFREPSFREPSFQRDLERNHWILEDELFEQFTTKMETLGQILRERNIPSFETVYLLRLPDIMIIYSELESILMRMLNPTKPLIMWLILYYWFICNGAEPTILGFQQKALVSNLYENWSRNMNAVQSLLEMGPSSPNRLLDGNLYQEWILQRVSNLRDYLSPGNSEFDVYRTMFDLLQMTR